MNLYRLCACLLLLVISATLFSQESVEGSVPFHFAEDSSLYTPALKPFYHGVASGDPLPDRVIIWTRITPTGEEEEITVAWEVGTDTLISDPVATGSFTTHAERDYTVKVDVEGLVPNTTYYYRFQYQGINSLTGRTKTAPVSEDHLKFAVVSCSNYEAGYFNAYGRIADRNDLNGVIHLGDYIYELPAGVYGDTNLVDRRHQDFELISLAQYRARYGLYRLDRDLQRAHQQHPFINIWDDHESANDAWKGGAENHTENSEGDWDVRKAMSRKAFFEWIPIRDTEDSLIFRTLRYGNLVDLIMLDTRLEGRDEQVGSISDPDFLDPSRSILGETQKQWLKDALLDSEAQWKIIGNQVIFSEFHVGWAGALTGASAEETESLFLDIWDGYPIERQEIISFFRDNDLGNTVMLTGDFHSSFGFDIADSVVDPLNNYAALPNYNAGTGEGAIAVEFATPSISSANFDENTDPLQASLLELVIQNGDAIFFDPPLPSPNPHMKWVDLDRHGYLVLDVKSDRVQSDWYYVDRLDQPSSIEAFGAGFYTREGVSHLLEAEGPTDPKSTQDIPAPLWPLNTAVSQNEALSIGLEVLGMYPNPSHNSLYLQMALNESQELTLQMTDVQGKVMTTQELGHVPAGIQTIFLSNSSLPAGVYLIQIQTPAGSLVRKIMKY